MVLIACMSTIRFWVCGVLAGRLIFGFLKDYEIRGSGSTNGACPWAFCAAMMPSLGFPCGRIRSRLFRRFFQSWCWNGFVPLQSEGWTSPFGSMGIATMRLIACKKNLSLFHLLQQSSSPPSISPPRADSFKRWSTTSNVGLCPSCRIVLKRLRLRLIYARHLQQPRALPTATSRWDNVYSQFSRALTDPQG